MTIADITDSQFLVRLAELNGGRDGAPSQQVLVESEFFKAKEIMDRLFGLVLLIATLPVIGILIVLIRLNSRGPGIFRQLRVGKGGRIFTMYKLRSMRIDAEAKTGPAWSPSGADPRVTRLGYWLRRLHLDELPQLINVVRGEMSIVGPRPERPEFVQLLAEEIPGYLNRIMVEPGITGLAQINLPPDTDLYGVQQKLMLDCEYIRTAGLWLDIRIILCTALRVLWIKGPAVTRLLGLERRVIPHERTEHVPTHSIVQPEAPVSLSSLADRHEPTVIRRQPSPAATAPSDRLAPEAVAAPVVRLDSTGTL